MKREVPQIDALVSLSCLAENYRTALEPLHSGKLESVVLVADNDIIGVLLTPSRYLQLRVEPKSHRVRPLTNRQSEVLGLIRLGLTNGEIAERLGISEQAVKHHTTTIYRKLGVDSRPEAMRSRESD
jgi:DNA-binding NarL/FixJ family response regulator